ncbi:MAG: pyridoxamine 5'-phosphate oxidase [Ignavibacteria bacterium]|nr:pyridoxamine 5'-phosphate oxidase [Ignavibacteria bacterium]MBT8383179.1 pyridoxamine 5'-phosphate oxidase [Ignavibacteria bacterium]MBT8390817.1 pyridoxamine 5'-phosphate oxidase [Ignavibacteria bacterium]NNJ53288.1 pyridoxamine 5'-phosphate oxidase [Ignavibacteriaceae bacterium]NNL20860.1 pyridoxamine 5'-phosphate oxidase [Ignavibacteriaceae bacterium]
MLNHKKNLNYLRREYKLNKLSEKNVRKIPFLQFSIWFDEVLNAEIIEPNAMILSTADKNNKPSARVVLMKGFDETGFTFFTNYNSKKGKELSINPNASLLFFWVELERQVRVEGRVKKVSKKDSELYFNTRPFESRIGALASSQSIKIDDRSLLEKKFNDLKIKYAGGKVPVPDDWGGYKLIPNYFEFWQGRENRLHDRIGYKKRRGEWIIIRLSP